MQVGRCRSGDAGLEMQAAPAPYCTATSVSSRSLAATAASCFALGYGLCSIGAVTHKWGEGQEDEGMGDEGQGDEGQEDEGQGDEGQGGRGLEGRGLEG